MSIYESNHKARGAKLSIHRQVIKEAIEHDLVDEEDIIAVFYGGSIGN